MKQTIILKSAITIKYNTDLDTFKQEFKWGKEADGEDAQLIGFSFMNGHLELPKEFVLDVDYVHVSRYGTLSKDCKWIRKNFAYYWHIDSVSEGSHKRLREDFTLAEFQNWIKEDGGSLKDIW